MRSPGLPVGRQETAVLAAKFCPLFGDGRHPPPIFLNPQEDCDNYLYSQPTTPNRSTSSTLKLGSHILQTKFVSITFRSLSHFLGSCVVVRFRRRCSWSQVSKTHTHEVVKWIIIQQALPRAINKKIHHGGFVPQRKTPRAHRTPSTHCVS